MLQEYIESLTIGTLLVLYKECEQLANTGILPSNAVLRQMLIAKKLKDDTLTMTLAASCVYRTLATKYVKEVIN